MKRIFAIAVSVVFVMSMAAPVLASDLPKPVDKLTNGVIKIIKSPLKLYEHSKAEMDKSDLKPVGLVKGIIESPFHMLMEGGHGVIDVLTFPVE